MSHLVSKAIILYKIQTNNIYDRQAHVTYSWHDIIGNIGVILIVGSYLLLQIGKLASTGLLYSCVNAVGAALIISSLLVEWNASAFMIEFFWLLISLLGVGLWVWRRQA